jgi:hypothetical protein
VLPAEGVFGFLRSEPMVGGSGALQASGAGCLCRRMRLPACGKPVPFRVFAAKNVRGWLRACCIYFASPHLSPMANDVEAVSNHALQPGYLPKVSLEPDVPVVCTYVPPFAASLWPRIALIPKSRPSQLRDAGISHNVYVNGRFFHDEFASHAPFAVCRQFR